MNNQTPKFNTATPRTNNQGAGIGANNRGVSGPGPAPAPALTNADIRNLTNELANNGGSTGNLAPIGPAGTTSPTLNQSNLTKINNITSLNNNQIAKLSNNEVNGLLKRLETQNTKLSNEINKVKNNKNKTKNTNTNTNSNTTRKSESDQPSSTITQIKTIVQGDSKWSNFVKILVFILVLIVLVVLIRYLIIWYQTSSYNIPFLLQNTKNAKYPLAVSQDPTNTNYIPIVRSDGQSGIQFTYSFWFLIDNFDYKKGEWKHVFHKGNDSAYPNRAPGIWIHPNTNTMRIYMNTQDNILEYVDVENIPLRKWVYMNVMLSQSTNDDFSSTKTPGVANLDIYVNGYLKIRKQLTSLPKQNDDDFWINMYGGFEGYVSNIKYYPYTITYSEIASNISSGPSANNCINTGEIPPYLDDNWWFQNKITA